MLFFDQRTGNMTSSLKILLISTTVLSTAIMLKLSAPAITDLAGSDVSSLWNGVVSWLKPPYLYLVINGIIITIVASSKLQSKSDDVSASPLGTYVQVQPDAVFSGKQAYSNVDFNSAALAASAAPPTTKLPQAELLSGFDYSKVELDVFGHVDARVSAAEEAFTVKAVSSPAPVSEEEMEMKRSSEFVISKSTWTPTSKLPEYSPVPTQKPPPSARFSHRRKASIEGKTPLGVSKSKRQDTLESTWKTITEGRAMPLKRHLKKSDTWESHGRRQHHLNNPSEEEAAAAAHKMTKSETFNDSRQAKLSEGSGKLKKEPSLSQDELNKRVEAFIKKFNEDMRLQRQESLNQYMEMINRGAH